MPFAPISRPGAYRLASQRSVGLACLSAALLVVLGVGLRLHSGVGSGGDLAGLQAVQALLAKAGEGFWSAWSVAGLGLSAWLIVAALDRRHHHALAAAIMCLPVGGLLTHLPKLLGPTLRPPAVLRPDQFLLMGEPILRSASMPSGHSLTAFAIATVLHASLPARPLARGLVWGLALLVPLSRLLTGAHWPSDVLAGSGLGLLTGLIALKLAQRSGLAARLRRPLGQRSVAVLEAVGGLALVLQHTGYPAAVPMQWALAGMAWLSAWRRWQTVRAGELAQPVAAAALRLWAGRLVLGCLLAGLLLSILLAQATWAVLVQAWADLPWWLALLAWLGWWGSYALRTERLRREWARWAAAQQPQRPAPSWLDCLSLFLTHNAALVLLPMRAGEAGYPLWLRERWGVPVRESLRSLLWLRLQDAAALMLLSLWWLLPAAAALLASVCGVVLLLWLTRSNRPGQAPRIASPGLDVWGWALTLANWALRLAVIGALLAALTGLNLDVGVLAALGGEWAAALPVQAPAGLGSYEAGMWAAVATHIHPPPASLVPAALAVHLATLLLALASWLIWRAALALALGRKPRFTPATVPPP